MLSVDGTMVSTAVVSLATAAGGFWSGRKTAASQDSQTAVNTVELLQIAVAELERQGRLKDEELADLRGRVGILEDLVTQRAEVEAVHEEVRGVRGVVNAIAAKVGA